MGAYTIRKLNGGTRVDRRLRVRALQGIRLRQLEHLSSVVSLAPGEQAFSQGDMATSVFVVVDGFMRLYTLLEDGRRQIIRFALPGDLLGMTSSAQYGLSAAAIGSAIVLQYSINSFAQFVEDKLPLLQLLNGLAVLELDQAQEHIVLLGRCSAEEKVLAFLTGWHKRLMPIRGASKTIPLPMTRKDIADHLGLTIETVCRIFKRLEREGAVKMMRGGIRLLGCAREEAVA